MRQQHTTKECSSLGRASALAMVAALLIAQAAFAYVLFGKDRIYMLTEFDPSDFSANSVVVVVDLNVNNTTTTNASTVPSVRERDERMLTVADDGMEIGRTVINAAIDNQIIQ